ncbi:MAG TPA: hypothetical protein VEX14_08515 [Burkholderiaceae bacterium]|nr:hypothetical protein [Burkholderiaceae bacterium]
MSSTLFAADLTDPVMPSRRSLLLAAAGGLVVGCGGGSSPPEANLPLLPRPPVVPVDGPAWTGFGGNAQHTALGQVATQQMRGFYWTTPVDLNPQYANGALTTHYGSPLVTRHNTVLVPVKVGPSATFRVYGRVGATGDLLWQLTSDYITPPTRWIPSFNPVLTPDNRMVMPLIGGRVQVRADADADISPVENIAFYASNAAYVAAAGLFNASVFINTPLTSDSAGNVFFGFSVLNIAPGGPSGGGVARIAPDGTATFVQAADVTGVPTLVKTATNCAPALSADGSTLYVVFNNVPPVNTRPSGRLVALDANTLAFKAQMALTDPATGNPAGISDDATSSPVVGPNGDVFIGVLESNAPGHNYRGWLLHFDGALTQARTPGSFGWDNTPSVVLRAMVPQYTGSSGYLLLTKYNNYAGAGTGDGKNRMAILDPNDLTQPDPIAPGVTVMREILTILGPTADAGGPPGSVREWCVNTAAVDPFTSSVLMNSEDGVMYRWHLPSNTFSEKITLNAGLFQSYTPTLIGPDGRIYAINNATLHSIGQ